MEMEHIFLIIKNRQAQIPSEIPKTQAQNLPILSGSNRLNQ